MDEPIIEFVMKMMKLKFIVQEAIEEWDKMSGNVEFLNKMHIQKEYGIPARSSCLFVQDNMEKNSIEMSNATLLDK